MVQCTQAEEVGYLVQHRSFLLDLYIRLKKVLVPEIQDWVATLDDHPPGPRDRRAFSSRPIFQIRGIHRSKAAGSYQGLVSGAGTPYLRLFADVIRNQTLQDVSAVQKQNLLAGLFEQLVIEFRIRRKRPARNIPRRA